MNRHSVGVRVTATQVYRNRQSDTAQVALRFSASTFASFALNQRGTAKFAKEVRRKDT
jgi:hypothetical protein